MEQFRGWVAGKRVIVQKRCANCRLPKEEHGHGGCCWDNHGQTEYCPVWFVIIPQMKWLKQFLRFEDAMTFAGFPISKAHAKRYKMLPATWEGTKIPRHA